MSVEELVKQLRDWKTLQGRTWPFAREAADKLEELAAEVDGWKERVQYLSRCIDEKSAEEDRLKAALAEAKRENEALKKALKKDPHSAWWRDYYEWLEARNAGGKDG